VLLLERRSFTAVLMVMIDHRQVIQPKNVSISSATLAKLSDGNYEAVVATAAEPQTNRFVMYKEAGNVSIKVYV
jgi:hypothetical protein